MLESAMSMDQVARKIKITLNPNENFIAYPTLSTKGLNYRKNNVKFT